MLFFSFSRRGSSEAFNFVRASEKRGRTRPSREGAGKTGCAPHPRSHVQWVAKQDAHEQTGEAEAIRPSLRNGFTACLVLSLVSRCVTITPGSASFPGA